MSHFENGPLAGYNSLTDPHLAAYFTSRRIRRHLCQSGLITPDGHVVSENVYRYNRARQEHQRQVREMIAQAVVHKALDMERARQACFRQELERHARFQTVQRVRDEKRRRDEDILPFLTSRATSASPRRRSAVHRRDSKPKSGQFRHEAKHSLSAERHHHHHQHQHNHRFHDQLQYGQHCENMKREAGSENEFSDQSYESDEGWQQSKTKRHSNDEQQHGTKLEFKSDRWSTMPVRHQSPYTHSYAGMVPGPPRDRPKSSAPCGYQRSQKSKMKSRPQTAHEPATERSKCRVRMHYIGSSVPRFAGLFDKGDQVMVEQQPFGAGSLFVFKDMVKPDSDFEFISQRSQEFPFSLTFYVNGQAECRLSTCCEFKRKPGSLIGGVSKAHFRLKSVTGGTPCFRCFQDSRNEDGSHSKRKSIKNKKELTKEKKTDKDKEAGTKKSLNDTSNNSKTPATAKPVKTVKKKTTVILAKGRSSEHGTDEELKKDSDSERGSEARSRKSSIESHSSESSKSKSSNASQKSLESGKKRNSRNESSSSSESEEGRSNKKNHDTEKETDADSKSDSGDHEHAVKKTKKKIKKKTKRDSKTGHLPEERKNGHTTFNATLQKSGIDNHTYSNSKDSDSDQGHLDRKKKTSKEISGNENLEASDDESRKSNKNKEGNPMESSSSSSSSSDSEPGQDSLEHKKKNNREKNIHGKKGNGNISDQKDEKKSDDEEDRASNKGKDKEQLESSSSSSDSETEIKAPDHTIQEHEKDRGTPDRSILYDRKDSETHSIPHDMKVVQNMDNENERENSLHKVSEEHKGSESDSSSSSEADSPNKNGSSDKEDKIKEGKNRDDKNSDKENTDADKKESFKNERVGNNKIIGKVHQDDTNDVEHDTKSNFSKSSSRENSLSRKESVLKGSSHSLRSANDEKINKSASEERDRTSPKTMEKNGTQNDDSNDDKKGSVKHPSPESSRRGENDKSKSAAVEYKELLGNIEKYYIKEAEEFELKEKKTVHVAKSLKDLDKVSQKSVIDKDDASESEESSDDDILIGKEDLARAAEVGSYKGDDDQKGSSALHLLAEQKH